METANEVINKSLKDKQNLMNDLYTIIKKKLKKKDSNQTSL